MSDASWASRKRRDRAARALAAFFVVATVLPAILILGFCAWRGAQALTPALFVRLPSPGADGASGLANAMVGTLELLGLSVLMAVPVGVVAGLFVAEYRHTRFANVVRFGADILAGVPSILVGVAVYAVVVVPSGHFSGLAGALALALMMLPLVVRTTDELARAVPASLREAALALGAPHWRIALGVVLRTAAPGIRAGVMLAVARVAGETAPLLFTAFDNDFFTQSPLDPTSTMQVRVFFYTLSASDDRRAQAWAAALILVLVVLVLDRVARRMIRRSEEART